MGEGRGRACGYGLVDLDLAVVGTGSKVSDYDEILTLEEAELVAADVHERKLLYPQIRLLACGRRAMGGRNRSRCEIEVVRRIGVTEARRPDNAGHVIDVAGGRRGRNIDRDVKVDAVAGQKHRRTEIALVLRS